MRTYYKDNSITIYNGDCRAMDELSDESVQCVVTSPPYWGLRKYSGNQDLIWGENHCEHEWGSEIVAGEGYKDQQRTRWQHVGGRDGMPEDGFEKKVKQGNICSLCGAWKGAYGLEPTPEMYVQHTIEILREIRRVLRKDGVVFWNIGDSYYGGGQSGNNWGSAINVIDTTSFGHVAKGKHSILKPKDLCLIPFRVAIAAQEDGWWVRSVIIWSKPNPMPESVTDRPTESHEYILMLTKSARYYWDADAVREPHLPQSLERVKHNWNGQRPEMSSWQGMDIHKMCHPAGRNLRSVWTFPTQPYKGAHFATYPEKLVETCIKAATPEAGCCSKCGAPWARIRKPTEDYAKALERLREVSDRFSRPEGDFHGHHAKDDNQVAQYETLGWQPTCDCAAEATPSIVLDPFAGSGTTLWVAKKLGRHAIGYEISEPYCKLAVERNKQMVMI